MTKINFVRVCYTLKLLNNSNVQQFMSVIRDKGKHLDFRIQTPGKTFDARKFNSSNHPG